MEYCDINDRNEVFNYDKVHLKNVKVALILSILFGMFGIDRLYQGGIKMMLVKIPCVIMTLGIWYIIDWYYIVMDVKTDNEKKLQKECITIK